MTGFGRGAASGEEFTVGVEIKTVNNRYLDIHLRLSQELAPLEMMVRKRVGARLSRGRVDLNINFERTGATAYEVNRPLITGYVEAMREIQQQFNLAGEIDVNSVVRVPGALTPARDGLDDASTGGLEHALDAALDDLERMRESEGAALTTEMRVRVAKIEAEVPLIENAAAGLVDAYLQRLQKRIAELIARGGQSIALDAGRLAQVFRIEASEFGGFRDAVISMEFLKEYPPGKLGKALSGWRVAEHLQSAKGTEVLVTSWGVEEKES